MDIKHTPGPSNAYEDLAAAAKAALAILEDPDADGFDAVRVEQQLRAALAKAGI